ncbi:Cof-type HAD-IIB family hydrolase [Corynebacterium lubricantis]|uniref:Cof-type HAD-IIB family hydrolase n=1 Tax=Corynebacterium lubricantis TaxID=541095 RepID=UPI000373B21B|nr:Cof-type HAD-IIB family hydrolase [Corynebacterium lubricantis]
MTPRLIASDIDGTFLNSKDRVTPRLRDAVMNAINSGAKFALATGRPHRWIFPVLDQLPIRPMCVCSNGAVIYDSADDKIITAHNLPPETLADIAETAQEVFEPFGGVAFGVERAGQSAFDAEEESFLTSPGYRTDLWTEDHGVVPVHELVSQPAVKLILRNSNMVAQEMFDAIAPKIDPDDAHVTFSMSAGLLEVSAPGVTKATGVSTLAAMYGIEQKDVAAFGDMPNDIEMLAWAGTGVAMGNAAPQVRDGADTVTATNDEYGVAVMVEGWFNSVNMQE